MPIGQNKCLGNGPAASPLMPVCLKLVMCAIAQGGLAGFFAGAKENLAISVRFIGKRHKAAAFMRTVTEGLRCGLAAGAPEIVLASFDLNGNRLLSGNYRLCHVGLLQALADSRFRHSNGS